MCWIFVPRQRHAVYVQQQLQEPRVSSGCKSDLKRAEQPHKSAYQKQVNWRLSKTRQVNVRLNHRDLLDKKAVVLESEPIAATRRSNSRLRASCIPVILQYSAN